MPVARHNVYPCEWEPIGHAYGRPILANLCFIRHQINARYFPAGDNRVAPSLECEKPMPVARHNVYPCEWEPIGHAYGRPIPAIPYLIRHQINARYFPARDKRVAPPWIVNDPCKRFDYAGVVMI